jgi:hypothetical protein
MASEPVRFGPVFWKIIHLYAKQLDIFTRWDYERNRLDTTEFERKHNGRKPEIKDYSRKRLALWDFLYNLDLHIPCESCGRNFLKFRDLHPLPEMLPLIESDTPPDSDLYFKWSVDLHNHANIITKKPEVSYEEAEQMYNKDWTDVNKTVELRERQKLIVRIGQLEQEIEELQQEQNEKSITSQWGLLISLIVVIVASICSVGILLYRR